MESLVESGTQTAKKYYGESAEGWTIHCNSNIFGLTALGWQWFWSWSPAKNARPQKLATLKSGEADKYSVTALTWTDENGKTPMVFNGNTVYTATVNGQAVRRVCSQRPLH